MSRPPASRLRFRRRPRRVLRVVVAAIAVGAVAASVAGLLLAQGKADSTTQTTTRAATDPVTRHRLVVTRLVPAGTGTLPAAVQDAAAAPLSATRAVAAGGLSAADVSTTDVRVVSPHGARTASHLPLALHDAAAAAVGGHAYLLGGGDGTAQHDGILRIDPGTTPRTVGRLPAPSSDQAAAVANGTVYVVGGYTARRWLDTVVAWRPGSPARVVGHLPSPVRYAAVTAVDGRVVVAGGSLPNGTASRAVYAFDPATRRVALVGRLPDATTHAAAATVGGTAYVLGGRGAAADTPTDAIESVDVSGTVCARRDAADRALGRGSGDAGPQDPGHRRARALRHDGQHPPAARRRGRGAEAAKGGERLRGGRRRDARRRRAARARPRLRPQQPEQHGRRHRPAHLQDRRATSPSASCRSTSPRRGTCAGSTSERPGEHAHARSTRRRGSPAGTIPVEDPYNLYFTPNGRYAIVVAERLHRLDFRDPNTFALQRSLHVPCAGVDHMDFSADGTRAVASCEFSGQLLEVDVEHPRVIQTLTLPNGFSSMPQDVKLSPDGRTFWVADMMAGGLWKIDAQRFRVRGFLRTGHGVHGLYPSRDARFLYASNRGEGSISVISFRTGKVLRKWWIPGGGSPDMGGVSADGKVLWLSGRYNAVVYAISTRTGKLLARIPVGNGPHGVCVWPQPGRHSLGHTGILR